MKNIIFKKQKGFTLVELIIVIVIIGILAAVTVVGYQKQTAKARDSVRLADLDTIKKALELYKHQNGTYPDNTDTDDGLGAPSSWDGGYGTANDSQFIQPLVTGGFLPKVPTDPKFIGWSSYRYFRYSTNSVGCGMKPFYILTANLEGSTSIPLWTCGSYSGSGGNWRAGGFE
jgi:type II secretion system protein G